jgi:purine-binding chemotaxis protein CheW
MEQKTTQEIKDIVAQRAGVKEQALARKEAGTRTNTAEVDEEEFVTFYIGEERYGVDILKVRDIIGMTDITVVPHSPYFLKGVINLRGNIVPVADLRLRFWMEEKDYDSLTVIIVVEVRGRLIGMIVDSVSDVVDIAVDNIQDTLHYSANIQEDFIHAVGKKGDQLIIILDMDRIMSTREIELAAE